MRRSDPPIRALGIGIGIMLVLAACGGGTPPPSSSASASGVPVSSGPPSGEAAEIEWYVGLGTGENEEQIPKEQAVVKAFNDSHPNIHLTLTVVDNTEAADTLATRIGAGDAPDIIGPIGIRGLQSFGDQLLDLAPYIQSSGVDLSGIVADRCLQRQRQADRHPDGGLLVVHLLQQDALRRGRAGLSAARRRSAVRRQGLDLGNGARPGNEADRRQGRQRRNERLLQGRRDRAIRTRCAVHRE